MNPLAYEYHNDLIETKEKEVVVLEDIPVVTEIKEATNNSEEKEEKGE